MSALAKLGPAAEKPHQTSRKGATKPAPAKPAPKTAKARS
jgi:hypothetical protein